MGTVHTIIFNVLYKCKGENYMKKIQEQDIESATEDALLNLYSYIKVASTYIDSNLAIPEMLHLGLIIDKMEETIEKLKPYYSTIDYVEKVN